MPAAGGWVVVYLDAAVAEYEAVRDRRARKALRAAGLVLRERAVVRYAAG